MAYGSFNAGPGKAPDEDVVRTDQIGIPGGIATLDRYIREITQIISRKIFMITAPITFSRRIKIT